MSKRTSLQVFFVLLCLTVLFFRQAQAQIPTITIPPLPTVVVPTLPINLTVTITPPVSQPTLPSTNTTSSTNNNSVTEGNTSNTTTTTNAHESIISPQTNTLNGVNQPTTPNKTGILRLDRNNTVSGKIILTKDINEVIFLLGSLHPSDSPLVFIMPQELDNSILFNFAAFLTQNENDSSVTLPQAISMEQLVENTTASVLIPANETITASVQNCGNDPWDGKMTALTILSQSALELYGKHITTPIQIGRSDCQLDLKKTAQITLTNKNKWNIGYRLHDQENFTEIKTLCPMKTQNECYMYEGKNLIVKTNHFTQFIPFKNFTFFDYLIAPFKESNLYALGTAILLTFLFAIILNRLFLFRKRK